MGIFKRLFGKKKDSKADPDSTEESKYMPKKKLPLDERFAINFRDNGGKFIYCDSTTEAIEALDNIVTENNWENNKVLMYQDTSVKSLIDQLPITPTKKSRESSFFFTDCENLIADDGSILISSNQIAEKRLNELPGHFVVYATTSQIVNTISEGLGGIKNKNKKQIPTNITTIKCFESNQQETDSFLSYGRSNKNLYLILLEDL